MIEDVKNITREAKVNIEVKLFVRASNKNLSTSNLNLL